MNSVQTPEIDTAEEQKFGPEIVLGEKLNNPYSLSNMQAAYESLVRTKAGEGVWGPYINYIVTHGFGYGDGTAKETTGKNICELGESWAYANEFLSSGSYYKDYWFDNTILSNYNMLSSKVLTRKQMYDCLTKDVKSIDDFKAALKNKYPSKSSTIDALY